MKIRNGFVSNSSSSSFVIIARQASIEEIDNENVKLWLGYINEGIAYDRPSKEQIEWMMESGRGNDFTLYYEYYSFTEEVDLSFDSEGMRILAKIALNPPEVKVFMKSFDKDYHFPEEKDLSEFIDGSY